MTIDPVHQIWVIMTKDAAISVHSENFLSEDGEQFVCTTLNTSISDESPEQVGCAVWLSPNVKADRIQGGKQSLYLRKLNNGGRRWKGQVGKEKKSYKKNEISSFAKEENPTEKNTFKNVRIMCVSASQLKHCFSSKSR